MPKTKVLIVDDEKDILDLLEYNLEREDYNVYRALDGEEAIEQVEKYAPDLILLDIMMPKMDGVETCRKIRETEAGKDCCVIFLTARAEEYSEIAGFEAGADDYIAKPIKPRVLMSRVKAVLRRTGNNAQRSEHENTTQISDLEILHDEFLVRKSGETITLPKKEFQLLELLASRPGKVFARDAILKRIWGTDVLVGDRTIDVHIRKLRKKIGKKYIETIKGVGYKFARE